MPEALITDANVWIDLHVGGVLSDAVKAGFDFVLPDVIQAEFAPRRTALFERLQLLLQSQHVSLGELEPDGVELAYALATQYRKPQRADIFALAIAKVHRGVLVTGDKDLREAAETEGVEVHGTLWLIERMVTEQIIDRPKALAALERMLDSGRRLPKSECHALHRRWSTGRATRGE